MILGTGTPRRAADAKSMSTLGRILTFLASLDKLQLGMVLFLSAVGLIFVYWIGVEAERGTESFHRHLFWLVIGLAVYVLCALPDPRRSRIRILAFFVYPVTVLLLIPVLIPGVGLSVNGARRWLGFGLLRIQPSEFSKLGLILALSALFSGTIFDVNRPSGFLTAAGLTLLPFALIVAEPDLGSALVCIPIFLAILFCAGLKWRYLLCGIALVALVGGAAVFSEKVVGRSLLSNYQKSRIDTFLHPDADPTGAGYNVRQAKLAVGSGGVTGKGIGKGVQHPLGYLAKTVANNDFIFSVIAEETGFLGALALLSAYALLFYSVLRTAFVTEETFGRSLCVGVAALLFTHMFINIGMNIGVMPVTGLPLPLVSRGGSFTVVALAALGMVQAVHRHR